MVGYAAFMAKDTEADVILKNMVSGSPKTTQFAESGIFLVTVTDVKEVKYKLASFVDGNASLDVGNMLATPAADPGKDEPGGEEPGGEDPGKDEPVVYTLSFDLNYTGAPNPPADQKIVEGKYAEYTADPVRTGYTFGGWFMDAAWTTTRWDFDINTVKGTTKLYAKWTPITYKVSFDTGGISPTPAEQPVQYGGLAKPPTDTKDGYALDGWYTNAARLGPVWDFSTDTVKEDITLYGEWTRDMFTVRFDLAYNGAPAPEVRQVAIGRFVVRPNPAPQRTGFTFDNWYTELGGSVLFDFTNTPITADTVIYAGWTQIYYTVRFDTDGGSPIDDQSVAHGSRATRPPNTVKTGFAFDNWYTAKGGDVLFDFTAGITSQTTVYAKWTQIYHTVTFNTGGGEPTPAVQSVPYGSRASAPTNTKTGYTLDGWYTAAGGTTKWNFTANTVTSNITLYGTWRQNYLMALDHSGTYVFPSGGPGYGAQAARTVTVTNAGYLPTGALTVDIVLPAGAVAAFTVSLPGGTSAATVTIPSIPPGGTATFNVTPNTGLAMRSTPYTSTIRVQNTNITAASFGVSFKSTAFTTVAAAIAHLNAQTGGADINNPVPLSVDINLSSATDGWRALVDAIEASGKYTALDLSFNSMNGATSFSTGGYMQHHIVSLVLPDEALSIAQIAFRTYESGHTCPIKVSGANIQNIWTKAFGDTGIVEVDFPNATYIGVDAFSKTYSLKKVNFPKVTAIDSRAFELAVSLQEAHFPEARTVGESAFRYCTALTTIGLPKVTFFGDSVFGYTGRKAINIYLPAVAPAFVGNPFLGVRPVPSSPPVKLIYIWVPSGNSGYTDDWKWAFDGDQLTAAFAEINVKTPWPY
jgi:uncharacterized repeat protein (TIGR02543 family)